VKSLWQTLSYTLPSNVIKKRQNRIDYQYDELTGRVLEVAYQKGFADQFFHRYNYQSDGKLLSVETSNDHSIWVADATYKYYDHGPLMRVELGEEKVQGLDYTYTLQGWLKTMNSAKLDPANDPGGDNGTSAGKAAIDVAGYQLHYFEGDYTPNQTMDALGRPDLQGINTLESTKNLYNGNISAMATSLSYYSSDPTRLATYNYDDLNRLQKVQNYLINPNTNTASGATSTGKWDETFTYDRDGNIQHLTRKNGAGVIMDDLIYTYLNIHGKKSNRLGSVSDASGTETNEEFKGTHTFNYDYSGNLASDISGIAQDKIDTIRWSPTNKMTRLVKTGLTQTRYYDAAGQLVLKLNQNPTSISGEEYVRDAKGNIMATYSLDNQGNRILIEQPIYGSARVGIYKPSLELADATPYKGNISFHIPGQRQYEITNHLGNVIATVSDKKNGNNAIILSSNDYYAFGSPLQGRSYTGILENKYRFGFNSQMKDDDISGEGNHNSALYWEYDSRLGRRWNLDPVRQAMISQYACFDGNPIWKSDILGNKASDPSTHTDKDGNVVAVIDDGDKGVYKHSGNKNETINEIKANYDMFTSRNAGGKYMGETLTPLSFADFGAYEKDGTVKQADGAKIDFNSNWATTQVNSIIKANPSLPVYALNARKGKIWDLKYHTPGKEGKNNPGYGSKLGSKYASARDAGNFAAGAVAQMAVTPNIITDYGYGTYNQSGNNAGVSILSVARDLLILDCIPIIGVYNVINTALTGEDKLSREGQEAGKAFIRNQNVK